MEPKQSFDKVVERPPSRYMKQMPTKTEDKMKVSYAQDSGLYQLQLFNMVTSEGAFAATMSMEIQKIQDEIKSLDIDSAIRLGKASDLSKIQIKELKKWLFSVQSLNKEAIEKKINSTIDTQQILEAINVKDPSEGVKKLFKILQVLEIMITKVNEMEAVLFLKYDEHISSIKEGKSSLKSKISQLAQGISLSKFSVIQANQERQVELYDIITKNSFKKQPEVSFEQIKNTEDLLNYLKRMCNSDQNADFINKHISQMVKKEKQLTEIIREQESQISQFKREMKCQSGDSQFSQVDQKQYLKIIDQVESDFNEERRSEREIITNLREKLGELKIELDESQKLNKSCEEKYAKQQQENQNIMEQFAANKNDMEDTYENALKEQMENLRIGFLTQIANQQEQLREQNKKKFKEIDEIKVQLKRESENKRLLLRKLEILQPI